MKGQCVRRRTLIQCPVNQWKRSQEVLWIEFVELLFFRMNIMTSTGFVCIQYVHRICTCLNCVCVILGGSLPLHKTNQWVLYPTQTVSCKFGCSRAEDAYGVEAQSKSEWSPVSDSQSDKFSFNIIVLFYSLDFFEKIGMSWVFLFSRILPLLFFHLTNTMKLTISYHKINFPRFHGHQTFKIQPQLFKMILCQDLSTTLKLLPKAPETYMGTTGLIQCCWNRLLENLFRSLP